MTTQLAVEERDGGAVFTLNRPGKRNALSTDLVESLISAIDTAHAKGVEVIVFQGTGKNFSAGFDFSGWTDASEGDLVLRFIRIEILLQKVATSPAVTIALAHGKNFGAGVDLIGACKRRIADPDATFRMPGINFGLVLGTRRFSACVGSDTAREIQSSTRTFDASEGGAIGFLTEIMARNYWAEAIDHEFARTPDPARTLLHEALSNEQVDRDLALLARSAAHPGLKTRIAKYLASAEYSGLN